MHSSRITRLNGIMINILFVMVELGVGGSEKVVLSLAKGLDKTLFNVYIAYFEEGPLKASFAEICKDIYHIPKQNGFDYKCILQLSRIIRDNNISVINAHHYMSYFYSYLGSKIFNNRKLVFTEHSVPEVEAINSSYHKYFSKLLFKHTDAIIGISHEITQSFIESHYLKQNKVVTIINAVDVKRFSVAIDRNLERVTMGFAPDDFIIGIVANFWKVKNHICLLKAVNIIKDKFPHLRLLVVGSRQQGTPDECSEHEIMQFVENYNLDEYVILAGYRVDVPRLLRILDVFCLPSFSEGLPLSILEAMASAVPVIGSDVRGIKEVVKNGVTGLLFPSNDHAALSRLLERLITGPSLGRRLGNNGYDYVKKTHDLNSWVMKYENLFKGLCS
jgi:L-malate glycosyltransferase